MVSEAKSLGEIFKERRVELNLSLKEVESATNIRAAHLEAIEEGLVDRFLSKVYMYGFMRQYAQFLELDIEKLSRDFPDAFTSRSSGIPEFSFGIGTLEMRKKAMPRRSRLMSYSALATALFGVGFLAWLFARYLQLI